MSECKNCLSEEKKNSAGKVSSDLTHEFDDIEQLEEFDSVEDIEDFNYEDTDISTELTLEEDAKMAEGQTEEDDIFGM